MLFETFNQLPIFLLSMLSGFLLYIIFIGFVIFESFLKNKLIRHLIDFVMCITLAVSLFGFSYLINYGEIKIFTILGNILSILLCVKFLTKPIAKIKTMLYNVRTKLGKTVEKPVGKETKWLLKVCVAWLLS